MLLENKPKTQLNQYPPVFSVTYMTQLECASMGNSSAQDVMKALFSTEFNEDRCKRQWERKVVLFSPLSYHSTRE